MWGKCGNGRIDPGAKCGEGFWGRVELKPDSGLTSCCTAECILKARATCRYVEYVYCGEECGNRRNDTGEESDEGFWGRVELKPDSGLTPCCTAECTLKAGAACRYVEYVWKSVVMGVLILGRSLMRGSGEEWSLNLTVD